MVIDPASIAAAAHLPGTLTRCSLALGWGPLLLRRYDEPREAEFETRPTADQLIVLVRGGACTIESRTPAGWRTASYRAGDLGMIPAGEANRLRIRGPVVHQTLQLHVPASLLERAGDAVGRPLPPLRELRTRHGPTAAIMAGLEAAMTAGAPALYAETAAHYLVLQLALDAGAARATGGAGQPARTVARVDAFMRSSLGTATTLADIAAAAGIGVFQLIRLCRSVWGVTPAARLTALRLDAAREMLAAGDEPVTTIALECGYGNPSHFATAFRRRFGVAPTAYRRAARG